MSRAAEGSIAREAWAVFVKDVRSELRTRAALTTLLLFSAVVLLIVAFTVDTRALPLTHIANRIAPGTTLTRAQILSALLWIVLFFSGVAALPRTFAKEEEARTAVALSLAARPAAVFWGKLGFNAALMLVVTALVLPQFLILFQPLIADWPSFLLHLPVGALAMAGAATLPGAMVARAGGKTYLMLCLAFPILLPVLVFAINGTTAAIHGNDGNQLLPLVSYLAAMVALSTVLFEVVWSDT
jgi:heme exporter protein B